jgi:hypothetical protein
MEDPPRNGPSEDGRPSDTPGQIIARAIATLLNPITVTVMLILGSVLFLIGVNLFGLDQGGVLTKLQDGPYARGLITYLFSVGTIGAVVVLILAALVLPGTAEERAERFDHAKEVFTLLIGIFGTIIGFYFGAIKAEEESAPDAALVVAPPLGADTVARGDTIRVVTFISGGTPPYQYAVALSPDSAQSLDKRSDGWIEESVVTSAAGSDSTVSLYLRVRDVNGDTASYVREVVVR